MESVNSTGQLYTTSCKFALWNLVFVLASLMTTSCFLQGMKGQKTSEQKTGHSRGLTPDLGAVVRAKADQGCLQRRWLSNSPRLWPAGAAKIIKPRNLEGVW